MLKNLMLYRLGPGWPATAAELAQAVAAEPFATCAATQQKSTGWAPPRGHAHGALVEVVDGQWIMQFMIETKTVPHEAVRRKVEEQAAAIEANQGRTPGRKELRDLRSDAIATLLPQAFARQRALWVWLDPVTRILAVDAASQAAADEVITSLARVAGRGFKATCLQTVTSPRALMAGWLLYGEIEQDAFSIERECELKAVGDQPARIRFDRHIICTEEVRQHIREGKLPTRLALSWRARVGFTLTQALQLKKISFMDVVFDQTAQAQDQDERFDADAALATGELSRMIADLLDALGGEVEPGFQK